MDDKVTAGTKYRVTRSVPEHGASPSEKTRDISYTIPGVGCQPTKSYRSLDKMLTEDNSVGIFC